MPPSSESLSELSPDSAEFEPAPSESCSSELELSELVADASAAAFFFFCCFFFEEDFGVLDFDRVRLGFLGVEGVFFFADGELEDA